LVKIVIDDDDSLRISLAGAQEKTALLWHNNQWCEPLGETPTTHIFKLPMGLVGNMKADMEASVENEWLCSKIIAEFDLPIAHCDIGSFAGKKALIVERFDRKLSSNGSWIIRLPQEDFCQASGLSSLLKYQSDGGLSIEDCMKLLASSENATWINSAFSKRKLYFTYLQQRMAMRKTLALPICQKINTNSHRYMMCFLFTRLLAIKQIKLPNRK